LNCDKEFNPKRESRKYCSDSCRVIYHRKHGKKNQISKFQMQTLYNEVLSMVQDLNKPTNEIKPYEQPQTNYPINTTPLKITPPSAPKSYLQYLNEKRELENEEQYNTWLGQLENDPYLTTPQKKVLKQI
jgi:hypothetical protein